MPCITFPSSALMHSKTKRPLIKFLWGPVWCHFANWEALAKFLLLESKQWSPTKGKFSPYRVYGLSIQLSPVSHHLLNPTQGLKAWSRYVVSIPPKHVLPNQAITKMALFGSQGSSPPLRKWVYTRIQGTSYSWETHSMGCPLGTHKEFTPVINLTERPISPKPCPDPVERAVLWQQFEILREKSR